MIFTEWLYQHKTLLITTIILLCGGISGVFVLAKEEEKIEDNNWIVDSFEEPKEETLEDSVELKEVEEKENTTITVDMKGAVQNPKVYEVPVGTRIFQIIEMAGGVSPNAYTNNINLSKKVTDEMVIYIFTKEQFEEKISCTIRNEYEGEITEEIRQKESIIQEAKEEMKYNLNDVTAKELETLPGIGVSKANSIIEYRTQKGKFKSIEELKEIPGIKDGIYEKIKDYFTI